MKYFYIIFFLVSLLNAQEFKKIYEYDLDRSFENQLSNDLTEFEISPSGNYVIMITNEHIKTLNKDGNLIFEYKCVPKTNSKSSSFSDFIGGQFGKLISNIRLDEGSGFWLFEEENLIIILDWNLNNNLVMAYDLNSGKKLWETNQYRYTPGKDKQLGKILAASAVSAVVSQSYSMSALIAEGAFTSIYNDKTSNEGVGSKRANAFITALPKTDDFLLTNNSGITSINKKTGTENWTYDKRPIKIGETKVLEEYNELMLVNYNPKVLTDSKTNYSPNYFTKQGYLVRLDIDSGEEKAKIDFKGSFADNRIYIHEDMYILDYFGVEAYDLKTNKLIYEAISQEDYQEDKKIKAVKLEKDWIKPSKTTFDKETFYYIKSNFTTKKKRIFRHDLKTGEKIWQSKEFDESASIVDQSKNKILIKEFGIGKNFFTNIDKSTGKILNGPVKVKQPLLVDNRKPWIFTTQNHLIHNGKRLYFLNKETLEEEKDIKLKKAKIGDVYAMDLLSSGIVMIGEKGAAFYDRKGNFLNNIKIKNVDSALWTDKYILLITEGNLLKPGDIYILNINNQKTIDEIPISDLTIFSTNLDHVLRLEDKKDTKLKLYTIK